MGRDIPSLLLVISCQVRESDKFLSLSDLHVCPCLVYPLHVYPCVVYVLAVLFEFVSLTFIWIIYLHYFHKTKQLFYELQNPPVIYERLPTWGPPSLLSNGYQGLFSWG
jgi:hypothetical protein